MDAPWAHELSFNFSGSVAPIASTWTTAPSDPHKTVRVGETPQAIPPERDESPLFEPACDRPAQQVERPPKACANRKKFKRACLEKNTIHNTNSRVMDGPDQRSIVDTDRRTSTSSPSSWRGQIHGGRMRDPSYCDARHIYREIWQPGDADGQRGAEFSDRKAYTSRWRFFQSSTVKIERGTLPPKYVVLDDRAAYDILASKATTVKERREYWSFDFANNGKIRSGRPNRGRAALVDEEEGDRIDTGDGQGERSVGWTIIGDQKYYFTGEPRGYTEIVFDTAMGTELQIANTSTTSKQHWTASEGKRNVRNTEERMSLMHKRPKGKTYLDSSPSLAGFNILEDEDARDQLDQPLYALSGGRTLYAGMTITMNEDEFFPERNQGRVTTYPGTEIEIESANSSGLSSPGQVAKKMEDELMTMANVLDLREREIKVLKGEIQARDRMKAELSAKDAEIAQLKSDSSFLREMLGQQEQE